MTLLKHESSDLAPFRHGFFTRQGGCSRGIYDSLNLGLGSQDSEANVLENRDRVKRDLGSEHLIAPTQIHSAICHPVDSPIKLDGDGLVTKTPGLAIGVLSADCAPILFADPQNGVIGAAHAGWRGAVGGIIQSTVEQLLLLGADKETTRAVIGPTISVDAYEVGEDFRAEVLDRDIQAEPFLSRENPAGQWHFDLPRYCEAQLTKAGIAGTWLGACTYGEPDTFFSYRRNFHQNLPDYGRQGAFICIAA